MSIVENLISDIDRLIEELQIKRREALKLMQMDCKHDWGPRYMSCYVTDNIKGAELESHDYVVAGQKQCRICKKVRT